MPITSPYLDAIKHRHPALIFTTGYLNNPISFNNDPRFDPDTIVNTLVGLDLVGRDDAEFLMIDLGADSPQLYSMEMYTPVYTRENAARVFKMAFEELK